MRLLLRSAVASFMLALAPAAASHWSFTLYGGPATGKIFTQFVDGHYTWDSGVMAIAADRRLAHLGWGFDLMGEGQYQQYFFGHTYPSVALGLGLQFDAFPWERWVPTTFSIYSGPTYSYDPPLNYPRNVWGSRKGLLNYVSAEFAVELPNTRHWDAVFRVYHRSGMWGVYTLDADEVTVIGGGLRVRF